MSGEQESAEQQPVLLDAVMHKLITWAQKRDTVRALILTSTRTRPDTTPDPFSDYDVILAVTDIHPFFEDRSWLNDFGSVLVLYRDPIRVEYGYEGFAYITQYRHDRLKIDFTVIEAAWIRHIASLPILPDDFDVGYQVLLDKDNLTDGLEPPTYRAYIPKPPTEAQYLERIEVFFHEATYVAKHLWRDDLLPAKYNLDYMMKHEFLRQMLEWRMGIATNWSVKTGAYGKKLKKHTPPALWQQLEQSYVGAGIGENWDALFKTIDLYRQVAVEVGAGLGYAYPTAMEQAVLAYLNEIRQMGH